MRKEELKICVVRVPVRYINKLEKLNIRFTDFVIQSMKETFG